MLKEKASPVLFLGHDTAIHEETILHELTSQAVIGTAAQHNPRQSWRFRLGKEEADVHSLVPDYLRLAEAEAKWMESQK